MPGYVFRIHSKPIEDPPFAHLVDYSANPDWHFSAFDAAAQWRDVLTGMKVAAGAHLCQFEVEEFKPGLFAILCGSHPTKPESSVNIEGQIRELRSKIDALGGQIPNLRYGSKERVEKETLQQKLLADLKDLESDFQRSSS